MLSTLLTRWVNSQRKHNCTDREIEQLSILITRWVNSQRKYNRTDREIKHTYIWQTSNIKQFLLNQSVN